MEFFINSGPHLFQLFAVILLQELQPVFQCLSHCFNFLFIALGKIPQLTGKIRQLFIDGVPHCFQALFISMGKLPQSFGETAQLIVLQFGILMNAV